MLQVEIFGADGCSRTIVAPDGAIIGKGAQSEIRLDNWRVAREHARLEVTASGVELQDLGSLSGVLINGISIAGTSQVLRPQDSIDIGPYRLRVTTMPGNRVHTPSQKQPSSGSDYSESAPVAPTAPPTSFEYDAESHWRRKVHEKLLENMDLRRRDVSAMSDERLREETDGVIVQIISDLSAELPASIDKTLLRRQVLNEAVGLGPLEELLADEAVTEVMVNRRDEIYVERGGRLERSSLAFSDDRAVLGVIERIVAPLGRRIDEASPMVDARLRDGSRVNAVVPPLALKGPTLTIRKFARRKLQAGDLVVRGSLSAAMADFLRICVEHRCNIIVSGGTGSGKTTLLNILSNFIPEGERVVTVEDAAELQLNHAHLVSLEARPANAEGKGVVTIRDLVRNTLRMRPDRIVVGECRGAEALDMLQAMNTGHEGSLTTLHANTPRDALARLETMVLMAGMDLPLAAIREQVASAVDIIVQQTRYACGSRLITSIVEVTGIESGKIQTQELFRFVRRGLRVSDDGQQRVDGEYTACNVVPSFYEALREAGSSLDASLFAAEDPAEMLKAFR